MIHWIKDKVLEARIIIAFLVMMIVSDKHCKRVIENRMASLIRRRSQEQIARMNRGAL